MTSARNILTSILLALPLFTAGQCNLCPNGSDVVNADRVIPFFNLDDNVTDPTCQDVQEYARTYQVNCDLIQEQAGFCGCEGSTEPVNACSFCPEGSTPVPEKLTPQGDTCGDVEEYVSLLSTDACSVTRVETILAYAYLCECPGATTSCSLCPEGIQVENLSRSKEVFDGNCGDIEDMITTYSQDKCEQSDRLLKINGFRCGCRGIEEFPECSIKENPEMCTTDLLATATEQCECYNFCNGVFTSCSYFPGNDAQDCSDGTSVSGCNYANAIEPTPDAGYVVTSSSRIGYTLLGLIVLLA